MATSFPPDRFDDIPDELVRVGAHRAPARRGRGWIAFAWAALATGVLVAAGVIGLAVFTNAINFDLPFSAQGSDVSAPGEPVVETAAPVLDPAVAITVLNGTATAGLANAVGDELVAQGWCGATGETPAEDGPCAGVVGKGSRVSAAANDIAATVVYYGDPVNEGAARALVEALGVGEVRLSADFPNSPMTIVLGSDYQPAAG